MLVTERALCQNASVCETTLALAKEDSLISRQRKDNPFVGVTPRNLAYVWNRRQ
jgi:hypothetical protein